jgi:hypothetical protein
MTTRGTSLALSGALLAATQTPITVDDLLRRAGEYVVKYETEFANVVAEEQYEQHYKTTRVGTQITWQTMLVSDFLLARVAGDAALLPFRDVRVVDGRAVRHREERLTRLFRSPPRRR